MTAHSIAPVVSVIVPAYNSAAYIGEAIDSLLRQTLREIEIIVIDDGSVDATFAVAEAKARTDARVRVVRLEHSSGRPAHPRNIGVAMATGEYIALLDADDIALPTRLAATVAAMKSVNADIGFADLVRLDTRTGTQEQTGVLVNRGFPECAAEHILARDGLVISWRPEFLGYLISTHSAISVPTIVWSRALLEQEAVCFDEDLICAEDLDLFFRLAARAKLVFLAEVVGVVRRHADSLTATRPTGTIADGIFVREKYLALYRERLCLPDIRRAEAFIAESLVGIAYDYWAEGDSRAARAQYLRSFRTQPSRSAAIGYLKAFIPRKAVVAFRRSV